jgi:hypothetical protein
MAQPVREVRGGGRPKEEVSQAPILVVRGVNHTRLGGSRP